MTIRKLLILVSFIFSASASASLDINFDLLSGETPMTKSDEMILLQLASSVEQTMDPAPRLLLNSRANAFDAARDLELIHDLIEKPNDTGTWSCGRIECGGEKAK